MLGEPADELIEELFGGDLKVERVPAVLDAYVEELGNLSASSHDVRRIGLQTVRARIETFGFRWLM